MSGHNKWSGIKHKKEANDSKRAKVFTKLAKPIVIATREGGENPDNNFKLRLAIKKAQEFNMPKDNIEKAIKRGTGGDKSAEIFEIIYEAMGPNGIMMIIKATTDNKNRTVSEIKTILNKNGGKFGENGSAMWNFNQVGKIVLKIDSDISDEIELIAIEAGAKDTLLENNLLNIFTDPKELQTIQNKLTEKNLEILESNLSYVPKSTVSINEKTRFSYEKLLEMLTDQDDVEEIFDNL